MNLDEIRNNMKEEMTTAMHAELEIPNQLNNGLYIFSLQYQTPMNLIILNY